MSALTKVNLVLMNLCLGRSYAVSSQRSLMQCLESIVQKVHCGVVIKLEKHGPDPSPISMEDENDNSAVINSNVQMMNGFSSSCGSLNNIKDSNGKPVSNGWTSCRQLIYVQRSAQKGYSVGNWPIPEAFMPDTQAPTLPSRTAHPIVKFTCSNIEPMTIENLPFDKYELEPSALTQMILSRRQPHAAWQCYVAGSHKNSPLGFPFGYLKASTNLNCVNLFVMPYNYPMLLPLLDELFRTHHCKPTKEWRSSFDNYIRLMPNYYASGLKRALQKMCAPALVPENLENCLSYAASNYLKKLKNLAKAEYDKMCQSVNSSKPLVTDTIRINTSSSKKTLEFNLNVNVNSNERFKSVQQELNCNEFHDFQIHVQDKSSETRSQCFRNAFDISRYELIDQIQRMQVNFLQPTGLIKYQDEDQVHSLPVSQMGNYQEYLKRMPVPLRELESAPVRQHMFGNPFKLDKSRGMIDEATDIDLVGNGGSSPVRSPKRHNSESYPSSPGRAKRRPGPLPRDFAMSRSPSPSSPSVSPPPSPISPSPLMPSSSLSLSDKSKQPIITSAPPCTEQPPKGFFIPIRSAETPPDSETNNSAESTIVPFVEDTVSLDDQLDDDIENVVEYKPNENIQNECADDEVYHINHNDIESSYQLTMKDARLSSPTSYNGNRFESEFDAKDKFMNNGPYLVNNYRPRKRHVFSNEEIELKQKITSLVKRPGRSESTVLKVVVIDLKGKGIPNSYTNGMPFSFL